MTDANGCKYIFNEPKLDQGPDYERGFVDGAQHQMKTSVDKAVNKMAQREWVETNNSVCAILRQVHDMLALASFPPKREWINLTDEEIKEIVGSWSDTPIKGYTRKLMDQIQDKLKEKNT
jgi:hypothetical protein